jgi:hypothetical protein
MFVVIIIVSPLPSVEEGVGGWRKLAERKGPGDGSRQLKLTVMEEG